MITSIELRSTIGPDLRRENLSDYWGDYFAYESRTANLHEITERGLLEEVKVSARAPMPHLDSQQSINRLLTALGPRHSFHRQFSEAFPELNRAQVLGMQLYRIMLRDNNIWIYTEIQPKGHMFPHAVYYIPRGNPEYERFCQTFI